MYGQIKRLKAPSLSNPKGMIVFALIFACIGTAFILVSQAATTTQSFAGKLTTRQTTQSFSITAETGQLSATLSNNVAANMTLTLIDKNNSIVATKSGPSPISLASMTQAGNYKLQVSSPDPISSKGLPFSLQTTYEFAATGDTSIPTAPTGLKANADSGNQVTLAWTTSTDNVGVVGYDIYRDSVKVGTSVNNTYQDKGLTPLVTYKYYVVAKDAAGNLSKASSTVRVKTLGTPGGDNTPPSVPTNLSASPTGFNSVSLSWTPSTDNSGVEPRYDLYLNGSLHVFSISPPNYQDHSLSSGTSYSYYVVARDEANNSSGSSNTVLVTTPTPDTEPPTTPTNLTASVINSKQINLSWAASTDNVGVTNYSLYANGVLIRVLSSTEYIHNNLTPSTDYSYYVIASDAAGNKSGPTASIVARTSDPDTEKPTTPGNFTVSAINSNQANMSWTASTDNVGVVGYKVYRNDNIISTLPPSATSFADTGVKPNEAYWYAVEAFDNEGNSNKTFEKRIYTPSSINITVTTPASGSTQSGIITVNGTTSSSSGEVTRVEIAGSYGSYQVASGTSNWTATLDTSTIPDSRVNDDPGYTGITPNYIFIKATDETTGDFKITPIPIIVENDAVPPTATVTSPASGSSQAGFYTITGTAADNAGVKKVEIKSSTGQGGAIEATGTTSWFATVTTQNSSYYPFDTVVVYDVNGNKSSTSFTVNKASQTYSGTISGRTYKDQNNNQVFDQGDEVLAGHTLWLYSSPSGEYGQYMKSVISDSEGKYSFSGLQDGKYMLAYNSSDYWTFYNNWFTNNPSVKANLFRATQQISLTGSATADFSWRPINRIPNPNEPGTFSLIASLKGPNGLTARQYDDVVTAQEIYDQTSAGQLIGEETNNTNVAEGYRFAGGFGGTTSASHTTDNNGKCSDPHGTSAIYWPNWYDDDKGTLFHEYGHSWENYWSCLHQDNDLTEYMVNRGLDLTDIRLHTNHMWSLKEIVAEDYRQLFSTNPDVLRQENNNLPKPTEIPGFRDYLINVYRTVR